MGERNIYMRTEFIDSEGRRVILLEDVDENEPDIFVGAAEGVIQGPNGIQKRVALEFEIEADSVDDAFDRFDAHKEKAGRDARDKISAQAAEAQKKILIPGKTPMNGGRLRRN